MGGSADDISARASVQICQQKMHQLNVDCLTVLDGDQVVGVISHWDVEKALEHRLGSEPVNDFMSRAQEA
jgi:CBS domain-containing protein